MKRLAALFFLSTSACATAPAQLADSIIPFNIHEADWAKTPGNNRIVGNAFLRTVGGDVKTCAGSPVSLFPFTTYGEDRMRLIYGSKESGFSPIGSLKRRSDPVPEYLTLERKTTCDSNGKFSFSGLADGTYFVTTGVGWGVPTRLYVQQQGGALFQKVHVENGETREIVLTAN